MNPRPPTDHLIPKGTWGGARKGAGRNPELSEEQHEKNNGAWGETVIAATVRIRDLMLNKKWDEQKLSPTHKFRLMMAWNIVNKYFPTTSPLNLNIQNNIGGSESIVDAFAKIAKLAEQKQLPHDVIDVEELVNAKIEGEE